MVSRFVKDMWMVELANTWFPFYCPGAAIGITVAGETGVAGPWSYQLNFPTAVIYDQTTNFLYIMDAANRRVMRWIPGASYGIPIIQAGSMSNPRGMRFDSAGNILIADASMHRIIQFPITCRKILSFDFSMPSNVFFFSTCSNNNYDTYTYVFHCTVSFVWLINVFF